MRDMKKLNLISGVIVCLLMGFVSPVNAQKYKSVFGNKLLIWRKKKVKLFWLMQ